MPIGRGGDVTSEESVVSPPVEATQPATDASFTNEDAQPHLDATLVIGPTGWIFDG